MNAEEFKRKEAKKELAVKAVAATFAVLAVIATAVFIYFTANSSSCARKQAMWESEYGYGVERTVTLYDFNGEVVEEWHGRLDVQFRGSGVVDLVFFTGKDTVERRVVVNIGYGQLVVDSAINGG